MPFHCLPNEIQQAIILDIPRNTRNALSQATRRDEIPNHNFLRADRVDLRRDNAQNQELPYNFEDLVIALQTMAHRNSRSWMRVDELTKSPGLLGGATVD
jgi:hypothetical protein